MEDGECQCVGCRDPQASSVWIQHLQAVDVNETHSTLVLRMSLMSLHSSFARLPTGKIPVHTQGHSIEMGGTIGSSE